MSNKKFTFRKSYHDTCPVVQTFDPSGQRVDLGNEIVRDEKQLWSLWSWRKNTKLRRGAMGFGSHFSH